MSQELKVVIKKEEGFALLHTEGYVNNLGGEKIAQECYKLMDEDYIHFVLNFEKSKVINSIGISILIEIIEKVLEKKGSLNFTGLTSTISKTFTIMGLTQYAKVFESIDEATKAVKASLS
jgi:anti-anti-sigma factor